MDSIEDDQFEFGFNVDLAVKTGAGETVAERHSLPTTIS